MKCWVTLKISNHIINLTEKKIIFIIFVCLDFIFGAWVWEFYAFWDKVFVHILGQPWIHDPPALASPMFGLQACNTMLGQNSSSMCVWPTYRNHMAYFMQKQYTSQNFNLEYSSIHKPWERLKVQSTSRLEIRS